MTYLLYLQLQAVNLHSSSLPRTQLFGLSSCHKGHTHQLLLSPSGQRARKGRLLKLDDVCMASLLLYMLSILPNRKFIGLPRWLSGKESTCQCRRHGFSPWCRKIPHAAGQLSPWATTIEPVPESLGATTTEAQVPESLCSVKWEATTVRSLCMTGGKRTLSATREKLVQQRRPSTDKINK